MTLTADTLKEPSRTKHAASLAERALTIPAWSDANLLIPRGSGMTQHDSTVTPYWSYWHYLVRCRTTGESPENDCAVERITLITGTQVGKTYGFLVPTLAWLCAVWPRDIGVVLPSHDSAKAFSKEKLHKSFEKSERLANLLPKGMADQARRLGAKAWLLDDNSIFYLNGAVALDLRSRDLPDILNDEFDALPTNVEKQGSPISLLSDRQKSYPADRIMVQITTPTTVNGLGWSQLVSASHARLVIACIACGAHNWLDPDQLESTKPNAMPDEIAQFDLAVWRCKMCKHGHTTDERDKQVKLASSYRGGPTFTAVGGWVPGVWEQNAEGVGTWTPAAKIDDKGRYINVAPIQGLHRSGWLNSLYSRFITCGQFLADDLRTRKSSPEDRQTHVNGWRAEPFVARADSTNAADIASVILQGASSYLHGQGPAPAWRLVITVDQQGEYVEKSWFPYVVRMWQADGSSFLIEAGRVDGFTALTNLCKRSWVCGGKARMMDAVGIDTANGIMIRPIRQWCAQDPNRRISIAGSGTMASDTPWSEMRPSAKNHMRMCGLPIVYYYNSNLFRDDLFEHIRRAAGRPAWNLPADAPDFYQASLVSEERIPQDAVIRGRPVRRLIWIPRTWTDPQGGVHVRKDNHWWDCEVEQVALVAILGWIRVPTAGAPVTAQAFVSAITSKGRRQ